MFMRRRMRRRAIVGTAVVGGAAYAAGHHMATKSAQQQQTDAQQNAQIADCNNSKMPSNRLLHLSTSNLLRLHHRQQHRLAAFLLTIWRS